MLVSQQLTKILIRKLKHWKNLDVIEFFNISACFSEFERDLIRERTRAGLEAARARGRKGGRRQGMTKKAEKKQFWQNLTTNKGIWQSIKSLWK